MQIFYSKYHMHKFVQYTVVCVCVCVCQPEICYVQTCAIVSDLFRNSLFIILIVQVSFSVSLWKFFVVACRVMLLFSLNCNWKIVKHSMQEGELSWIPGETSKTMKTLVECCTVWLINKKSELRNIVQYLVFRVTAITIQ